jgi:hypothetical protein
MEQATLISRITRRHFLRAAAVAGAGVTLSLRGEAAAEITGKVLLKGTPPPEKTVDLTDYAEVKKAYESKGPIKTRHYVLSPDGGLGNVFVYVKEGLQGAKLPVSEKRPVLDQINAGFYPYVLGVQVGQVFLVKNSEPYMETVHALPKQNKEFNIAQPLTGMVSEQKFDAAEVLIKVKCELHPWEFAFIGVVEHPFFAVTEKDGTFKLPEGLPPGKYMLEAVHPKAGTQTREITVAAGEKVAADFALEAPAPKK